MYELSEKIQEIQTRLEKSDSNKKGKNGIQTRKLESNILDLGEIKNKNKTLFKFFVTNQNFEILNSGTSVIGVIFDGRLFCNILSRSEN